MHWVLFIKLTAVKVKKPPGDVHQPQSTLYYVRREGELTPKGTPAAGAGAGQWKAQANTHSASSSAAQGWQDFSLLP